MLSFSFLRLCVLFLSLRMDVEDTSHNPNDTFDHRKSFLIFVCLCSLSPSFSKQELAFAPFTFTTDIHKVLLTMQMVCLLPSLLLSLLLARSVEGQACSADGKCDSHERCPVWKEEGECIRSKAYMTKHCPVSCSQQDLVKPSRDDCKDALTRCSIWADLGECDNNREMKKYCAKSCGTCENAVGTEGLCRDTHENCKFWASIGECANNPNYMLKSCAKSCGTCEKATEGRDKKVETAERKLTTDTTADEEMIEASQGFGELQLATGVERPNTLEVIKNSIKYMATEEVQSLTGSFKSACRNKHELCSYWAAMGECEANKVSRSTDNAIAHDESISNGRSSSWLLLASLLQAYMKLNCAPACNSCDLIDINNRCPPLPEDTEPALRPGALNKMFERIVATAPGNITDSAGRQRLASFLDGMPEYTVQVLSRPSEEPVSEISLEVDKELPPWVVTFDNFLSGEECDQLIALG